MKKALKCAFFRPIVIIYYPFSTFSIVDSHISADKMIKYFDKRGKYEVHTNPALAIPGRIQGQGIHRPMA